MHYKGLQLDPFQEEAIHAIDRNHSVLVTAPTGAGKTVLAEYAIEKCMEMGRRVIYTAPIKALSNQKYRDFYGTYGDRVGIVTGDVVLNQSAQVLLMTTEIFRNTIFDDITRLDDVEYVIFDEIHYINDIERGTVWEESIIFAPQNIKFVCLSATIPNINQFAEWMQTVREVEINVIEELERPVPLEHHLYLEGYGIGDVKALQQIQESIIYDTPHGYDDSYNADKDRREPDAAEIPEDALNSLIDADLIPYIRVQNKLPCLYFCFSRKVCEQNAAHYATQNFLTREQRKEILHLFDLLCTQYNIRNERNIQAFRRLVSKGIAYHHAGMLPTLKEVVERLFTSGLIRLLFTTETFAVGINMPACTVVFESLEKYDGVSFRYLKAREYHQMSGRAGRRGIDPIGYVYARVFPKFAQFESVKRILSGKIEPIESQFNLSYSSILNLYEKYGDDIYDVCTQSLSNFQNLERVQKTEAQIQHAAATLKKLSEPICIHDGVDGFEQVGSYNHLRDQIIEQRKLLKIERRAFKRKGGKRRHRKNLRQNFIRTERRLRHIESTRNENLCHNCKQFKSCNQSYRKITQAENRIEKLQNRKGLLESYQRKQIASRLKILEELGYIDTSGVLGRGQIASQIYGYEVQVTQLLFKGFFEKLSVDELNVLAMAIVCEDRKDWGYYRKLEDKKIKRLLRTVDKEVEAIRVLEEKYQVDPVTPKLVTQMSTAMLAWSQGCEFETLPQYVNLADGDFVRAFRLVIDLLRQVRRAAVGHDTLLDKVDRCLDKINRDVVDAERQLRAGQDTL
jgi:superfamily II RNA helicase